jgi:putative transposase
MARKHTPEQIVRKLREREGKTVAEIVKALGSASRPTAGGGTSTAAGRPTTPRSCAGSRMENTRLKRMVAERDIDIEILKEDARGNW